jgi:serine/threonine protein kinase
MDSTQRQLNSQLSHIDRICDQFEAAWRRGERPRIEDYLHDVDLPTQRRLLRELLLSEWDCRAAAGEAVRVDEYFLRFAEDKQIVAAAWSRGRARRAAERLPAETAVPQLLGDYEIVGPLGAGGMGKVFKARHRRLKKIVAVKVLKAELVEEPGMLERFRREMEVVGQLNHPNLVAATDAGEDNGVHFLVTEFVEGVDAAEVTSRLGSWPVADACEIVRQTALALQHSHERGLVHRDIKPSNLMVTPDGTVKVLDFGLARWQETGAPLTLTGQLMGTADYIAPEQARGDRDVDVRADLYSLGCTLYELLAGRPPYGAPPYRSLASKLMAHRESPFPQIREARGDIPNGLQELLNRLAAKERTRRPATPLELAAAMLPFAAGCNLQALLGRSKHATKALAAVSTLRGRSKPWPSSFAAGPAPPTSKPDDWRRKRVAWHVRLGLCAVATAVALFAGALVYWIWRSL